jgi:hypothetical protein
MSEEQATTNSQETTESNNAAQNTVTNTEDSAAQKQEQQTNVTDENSQNTTQETDTQEKQTDTEPSQTTKETENKDADKQVKDYNNIIDAQSAQTALKQEGFDYTKLQTEYMSSGDISKETRAELAKHGFNEQAVNNFIAGQQALVEKQMTDIAQVVGGVEEMSTVIEWAKTNLSEDEKKEIDSIHDPASIKFILKGLKAQMDEKEGKIPNQITGNAGQTPSDLFESMAEVEEAISDPKYSKDEVYREKIRQKITASKNAGKINL